MRKVKTETARNLQLLKGTRESGGDWVNNLRHLKSLMVWSFFVGSILKPLVFGSHADSPVLLGGTSASIC